MSDRDDEAAARYEDEANLQPAGPGKVVRAPKRRLSSHTPVRFDQDAIAAVKRFSDADGMTVSSWIRTVVDREIQRRMPRPSTTGGGSSLLYIGGNDAESIVQHRASLPETVAV